MRKQWLISHGEYDSYSPDFIFEGSEREADEIVELLGSDDYRHEGIRSFTLRQIKANPRPYVHFAFSTDGVEVTWKTEPQEFYSSFTTPIGSSVNENSLGFHFWGTSRRRVARAVREAQAGTPRKRARLLAEKAERDRLKAEAEAERTKKSAEANARFAALTKSGDITYEALHGGTITAEFERDAERRKPMRR